MPASSSRSAVRTLLTATAHGHNERMGPTRHQADPRRTTVVVVGVDSYEAGYHWELDGPAADAHRFAQWFVDRGVPPERLTALVSEPDDRDDDAVSGSVPYEVLPADRASVHRTLLRTVAAADSELLWVVWGGHGLVDAEGRRRLFYADTVEKDLTNLDFDALLAYYRSAAAAGHPRQIWLVDACQNLPAPGRRPLLPHEDYARDAAFTARDQAVLFAVRPGEAAANLSLERTGLFSREVLRLLGDESATPGWPPAPDLVMERLRERFTQLRAAGLAEQTPTYVWSRTWDGEEGQLLSLGRPATLPHDGPEPAPLTPDLLRILTDALLDVEEFMEPNGREEILGLLRPVVRGAIARHSRPRMDTISIVRTCWRRPGALRELAEAVLLCAGGGPQAERAHHLIHGLGPPGPHPAPV